MQTWQEQLKDAISSPQGLEHYAFFRSRGLTTGLRFKTLVPRYYLGLIDAGDPQDPIAKMAFPASEEAVQTPSALRDPIGDLARQAAPRLTHRYKDRALLHVTNLCPMYCRFCFRKNLMNERDENLYSGGFGEAFAYLSKHPEIEEVILTGGDPWMLSDEKLSALVDGLVAAAPGLKRLRFHSRMPVTLPARVTPALLAAVKKSGIRTFVVTHFNHAREVTAEARAAARLLLDAGFTVLNQSVLLKGVNDSPATLRELFLALGNEGVLPYYLHHCDLVAGAEHFRTSIAEGRRIWTELRGTLPGYLIPEYILDTPGGWGKIPVGGEFINEMSEGSYSLARGGGTYRDPL